MKKHISLLLVLIAAVMLVSLLSLVSHAAYMGKCFDGAYLTNNGEANTHAAGSGEMDVTRLVNAGDVGDIYGFEYQYIHAQGWFTDDDEFDDIGYQINDGDIVWGLGIYDANIIGLTGGTYALRFNGNIPISDGTITVTFYERLTGGTAKRAHAFTYTNKAPGPGEKQFSNYTILDNGGGAIGTWINSSKDNAYVEFTTAGVFKTISLYVYWASNPNVPNGPNAEWKCELFEFAYNAENTLAQAPVKTKTVTSNGDNSPAFKFDLEEEMPAGTYIVKFTLTNANEPEAFVINGETTYKKPYLILPKIDNPDASKFTYYNDPFNLVLTGEIVSGDFFLANPEDTEVFTLRDFDIEKGDHFSYDQIFVNGVEVANGNAAVIETKQLIDGSDGTITSVSMHGWYGNDNANIISYGYMIDDGNPVYGDFAFAAEPGFTVTVNVTGLNDGNIHKIQVVARLDNYDVVILNSNEPGMDSDVYVNYKAPHIVNGGLAYTDNGDGTCTITGIGNCTATEVRIPTAIDGLIVSAIGEKAFENQTQITYIYIPKTVQSIGRRAFYGCTGLTELTIPSSVSSIGAQIIYKADNIQTVYYNASYYPSTETENPFLNNASIKKVVFGGSSIGYYAARNLGIQNKIEEVEILDSVININGYAFYNCPNLQSVTVNAYYIFSYGVFQQCSQLVNVTIGDNVYSIGGDTFYECTNLSNLIIGNNVSSIESEAFYGCSSLASITIPTSVERISSYAFGGCPNLAAVYYSGSLDDWCRISFEDGYSNPCSQGAALYIDGELLTVANLPDSVAAIGQYAFYNCKSLVGVTIPDSVAAIGQYALCGCSNLISVEIPDSVTSIGNGVFRGCTSLTEIAIPNSVSTIGYFSFYGCTGLTEVEIPDSVTSIGSNSFYGCTGMSTITIPDSLTIIENGAFYNCTGLLDVFYYGTRDQWNAISIGYNNEPLQNASIHFMDDTIIASLSALYVNSNKYDGSSGNAYSDIISVNVGDKLYILGMLACKGKTVDRVVWTLNGIEKECSDSYEDRTDFLNTNYINAGWSADDFIRAGFGHAAVEQGGMMELLGVNELADGVYTVSIQVVFEDGTYLTLKDDFQLVVKAPPTDPNLYVAACNLSFADSIYIKYAISADDLSGIRLLIWTAPQAEYVYGTQNAVLTTIGTESVKGVQCAIFHYTKLAAKQMVDNIYARAFVEIDGVRFYSEVKKYSVLQYAYNKIGRTGTATTDQKLITLLYDMLQYGASAQQYLKYKTGRLATMDYYQINVVGGVLSDMCDNGLYLPGENVVLTAPATNEVGLPFACWQDSGGNIVGTETTLTVTVGTANAVYTAVFSTTIDYSLFEFESNGDGTCMITALNAHDSTAIVLPDTAPNGDTVTGIDVGAFAGEDITSITIPVSITSIGKNAFKGCSDLTDVYYGGSPQQWEAITVASGNDVLSAAEIHYATDGNNWLVHEYSGAVSVPV